MGQATFQIDQPSFLTQKKPQQQQIHCVFRMKFEIHITLSLKKGSVWLSFAVRSLNLFKKIVFFWRKYNFHRLETYINDFC